MNTQTAWIDEVNWSADGLVPAIAQDATSGRVLMMAWMNRHALQATVDEGQAVYWSRSRQQLWRKGESSGHRQVLRELRLDCDADTILLSVEQIGGIACHTGRGRCFYRRYTEGAWVVTDTMIRSPADIYAETGASSGALNE